MKSTSSSACLLLLIATLAISSTQAKLGFDLAVQFDDYQCFASAGYDWAVIRAYRSLGTVDLNAIGNLQKAQAAGIATDVYMFPCSNDTQITAEKQVDDMLANLDAATSVSIHSNLRNLMTSTKPLYSTVWIDIETNPSNSCSWNNIENVEDRCTFVQRIVDRLEQKGKKVGIYASHYMWNEIFGDASNCTNFSHLPLWYARYNNVQNFSDYASLSFGGWTTPYAKQFSGSSTVCSIGVDLNYY